MVLAESKLRVGVIYGDPENSEYVYMPGSELGVKDPVCVYEADGMREDIDMHEALRLIRVRSLKPARHPSGERAPAERRRKDTCCNRVLLHVSFFHS